MCVSARPFHNGVSSAPTGGRERGQKFEVGEYAISAEIGRERGGPGILTRTQELNICQGKWSGERETAQTSWMATHLDAMGRLERGGLFKGNRRGKDMAGYSKNSCPIKKFAGQNPEPEGKQGSGQREKACGGEGKRIVNLTPQEASRP